MHLTANVVMSMVLVFLYTRFIMEMPHRKYLVLIYPILRASIGVNLDLDEPLGAITAFALCCTLNLSIMIHNLINLNLGGMAIRILDQQDEKR